MKVNQVYLIQPISFETENFTLYQDEQIKILEIKNGEVKFLRLKTNEVLVLSEYALKFVI